MKRNLLCLVVCAGLLLTAFTGALGGNPSESDSNSRPKVILIGDSIRLSYADAVVKRLAGRAEVVSPPANGGDSSNVLQRLEDWIVGEQPDVVHFNCGIHDTKFFVETKRFQVPPERYEANLREIVRQIRQRTDATVLFATTTPIIDDRARKARADRDYELRGEYVETYNTAARRVMRELGVPVNDLHGILQTAPPPLDTPALIGADGVHLTSAARSLVGQHVAAFIGRHLGDSPERLAAWNLRELHAVPEFSWIEEDRPIRSLTFRNPAGGDVPTDVFAFYATPDTIAGRKASPKPWPAVVLIHGGGGTAFAEWVELWSRRGYAAMAMDLSGRRPTAPQFDPDSSQLLKGTLRGPRVRLPRGGPEADREAKFDKVGGVVADDWQYHAVAAVVSGHSLLRSFSEVDAARTAVTGISWGGYLTCLVASIDDRFQAAVPVYGCGYLYEGESVQKPLIDQLSPGQRAKWIRDYDPSAWLPRCRVPILFVNGTNDRHYPLDSYVASYRLVRGVKQIRIEPNMRHSHVHGWAPAEIGLFINHHLNGGEPIPHLQSPQVKDSVATSRLVASTPIARAYLHFTTDDGPLIDRQWKSAAARINGSEVSAEIPEQATIWMLAVIDEREAMTTTEAVFVSDR